MSTSPWHAFNAFVGYVDTWHDDALVGLAGIQRDVGKLHRGIARSRRPGE